ncbi:MAG: permease-like cell division protein FtsX [Cellvibrionales bacterium]|nr:permease-like cell division protein FtsX [Cellvibrionales bacterium]
MKKLFHKAPPKREEKGVKKHQFTPDEQVKSYFKAHWRVLKQTAGKFLKAPLDTLMTCSAIAIALALPVGFYLCLNNIQAFGPQWEGHTQISLFLNKRIEEARLGRLLESLEYWPEIAKVSMVDKTQALKEFQEVTGLSDVLSALDDNPLPQVIEVMPSQTNREPASAEALLKRLEKLPEVDIAQLDLAWVQRLSIIIEIGHRIAFGMMLFLAAGVLLVIGNTIRLEIESRRAEIEVAQLVGATKAFVRRPFLYTGALYGFIGGVIAMVILSVALYYLSEPIAELSGLYQQQKRLLTLSFSDVASLLFMAVLLGWVGSWLSVNRHLERLTPN